MKKKIKFRIPEELKTMRLNSGSFRISIRLIPLMQLLITEQNRTEYRTEQRKRESLKLSVKSEQDV